ncbi:MAG: squalene synthase HpnC [Candidatus Omnitrophica bacterium]|nr:squalene synthase HpnC [Candidatus Omnitrophota bacterium]
MENNPLRQAYRYCQWLTDSHYENFPVASWLLPRQKRPHVAAIYAFARSADDFSDEAKYQGRSEELLLAWRKALKGNGLSDHPIFLALSDTIHRAHLPVQLLDDLLTAFLMDATKRRYADWEELLTYCRYSANPVGRLVLWIFGIEEEALARFSDSICTGLQLANHWQDLRIDLVEKDRLYIPQTLLDEHRISVEELKGFASRPVDERFRRLMKELLRRTRTLFDEGEPLLASVKGRLRLELKLTLLGGREILNLIESNGHDPFRRRPVITALKKTQLLAHALFS